MIALIREYLLSNQVINNFVNNTKVKDALFFEFKPPIDISQYIIIKEKPISLGHIKRYQLDFHIYSKNMNSILEVEDALEEMLNDVRGDKIIRNDKLFIRDTRQLTGGGRSYIPDDDRIVSVRYFQITI